MLSEHRSFVNTRDCFTTTAVEFEVGADQVNPVPGTTPIRPVLSHALTKNPSYLKDWQACELYHYSSGKFS